MNQRSVFDRERYNERGRTNISLHDSKRRHHSRTPLSRKRQRYSFSRSRSPETYKNEIRTTDIFDRTDESPSRGHMEHLERGKFGDSPGRRHADTRRADHVTYDRFGDEAVRNRLSNRSERRKIDRFGDSPDRLDIKRRDKSRSIDRFGDTPARLDMESREKSRSIDRFGDTPARLDMESRDKSRSIDRFGDTPARLDMESRDKSRSIDRFGDTPARLDMKRRDKRRSIYTFGYTPDRSPVEHRDDRGYFDRFGNIPERNPLSYRDEDETLDRYDDAPDHSSVAVDVSEYSNSSSEYRTDRRRDRRIYSPYSSGDEYSDNQDEFREIPFKRESYYNEEEEEYGIRNEERYASAFDRTPDNANVPRYPIICKFYNNEGTCSRGDSCKFLHVCKYYINDDCKFGRGCKRSHNILDKQPRTILEIYNMIPDNYNPYNFINTKEITDLVKAKLRNMDAKLHKDKTKAKSNQPIFHNSPTISQVSLFRESSYLDRTSDNKIDRDDYRKNGTDAVILPGSDSSEDEADTPSQSLAEYIPLEINAKAKKKDKNITRKKRKKSNKKSKKCGDNLPIECKDYMEQANLQQCEDIKNIPTVQSTITFETQNPCRKFQVRKANDQWQISSMCDIWVNLDETDSEIFCKMYNSAVEIGGKVAEIKQE